VKQAFLTEGGESFQYIPCLNAEPRWIEALAQLVRQHTAGWPVQPPAAAALDESRAAALALGAPD
jgi:ferrochelatase